MQQQAYGTFQGDPIRTGDELMYSEWGEVVGVRETNATTRGRSVVVGMRNATTRGSSVVVGEHEACLQRPQQVRFVHVQQVIVPALVVSGSVRYSTLTWLYSCRLLKSIRSRVWVITSDVNDAELLMPSREFWLLMPSRDFFGKKTTLSRDSRQASASRVDTLGN